MTAERSPQEAQRMKRREPPFVSRGRLGVGVLPAAPGCHLTRPDPWRHDGTDPVRGACPPPIVSSFASRRGSGREGKPRRSFGRSPPAPTPVAER
jgi:hypothetical protein